MRHLYLGTTLLCTLLTSTVTADELTSELVSDRVGPGVDQNQPAMVALPSGGFAATWTDNRWGDAQVRMQLFDSNAQPTGSSIGISNTTLNGGPAEMPCIAISGTNEILIVWHAEKSYYDHQVWYQRLTTTGTLIGNNEPINLTTPDSQTTPIAAGRPNGGFVIGWHETNSPGGIKLQMLDAQGAFEGDVLQADGIPLETFAVVSEPTIAMRQDGSFDVAWVDIDHTQESCPYCFHEIVMRRFDATGQTLTEPITVSTPVDFNMQGAPSISIRADGSTRLIWRSGHNSYLNNVWLRDVDSSGEFGALVQLDDDTGLGTSQAQKVGVASLNNGNSLALFCNRLNDVVTLISQEITESGQLVGGNVPLRQTATGTVMSQIDVLQLGSAALVTWELDRWDPDLSSDIESQWLATDGSLAGTDFILTDDVDGAERTRPAIASRDDGTYAIVFTDNREGSGHVYMQWYNQDDRGSESNVKITEATTPVYWYNPPTIAMGNSGALVAWEDRRESTWSNEVYAQYIDTTGELVGNNFRVRNTTAGYIFDPVAAMNDAGRCVITWSDTRTESNYDIYMQLFHESGSPIGTNVRVNDDTIGNDISQSNAYVDMAEDGSFLVVWQDRRSGSGLYIDIYGQWFAADGTRIGSNFNLTTADGFTYCWAPEVAIGPDGTGMAVWRSGSSRIEGRRISAGGPGTGSVFSIDQAGGGCDFPSVKLHNNGAIVSWEETVGGGSAIRMRHLDLDGTPQSDAQWVGTDLDQEGQGRTPCLALVNESPIIAWTGAYGYGWEIWAAANREVCNLVSDIDGSGAVDIYDFSALLMAWGTSDPEADINNDGIVNTADFSQFLLEFGTTCPSQPQGLTEGGPGKAKRKNPTLRAEKAH